MDYKKVMILSQNTSQESEESLLELGKAIRAEFLSHVMMDNKPNTVNREKVVNWLVHPPIADETIHSRVFKKLSGVLPKNILSTNTTSQSQSYNDCDEIWLIWDGEAGECREFFANALADDKRVVIIDLMTKEIGKMNVA